MQACRTYSMQCDNTKRAAGSERCLLFHTFAHWEQLTFQLMGPQLSLPEYRARTLSSNQHARQQYLVAVWALHLAWCLIDKHNRVGTMPIKRSQWCRLPMRLSMSFCTRNDQCSSHQSQNIPFVDQASKQDLPKLWFVVSVEVPQGVKSPSAFDQRELRHELDAPR